MMDKIVVEKEVLVPTERGGGTGSSAIWAVALIIIVGLIFGALYYSGALGKITGPGTKKVNVEVTAPAAAPAPANH